MKRAATLDAPASVCPRCGGTLIRDLDDDHQCVPARAQKEETNGLRRSVPGHWSGLQQKIAAHGKEAHDIDVATMPEDHKRQMMSLIRQD